MTSEATRYLNHGQRSYSGDALRTVAFPLGGIGTGTVSLTGRGSLDDWEIFHHPGKGMHLPHSFFCLWYKSESSGPVTRVLERQFLPPYHLAHGLSPARQAGLPRFREARFYGEYPFAWLDLEDPCVPLAIRLRAWNPLIPLNPEDSGLPVALLDWHLVNTSEEVVDLSIAFSAMNPVGWDGLAHLNNRFHSCFGGNLCEAWHDEDTCARGLLMSNPTIPDADARAGSLAISTTWADTELCPQWQRGAWVDDLQGFWDDFREDGRLEDHPDQGASPAGQTDVGSVVVHVRLAPGESADVPFTLSWAFANLHNSWNTEAAVAGHFLGNEYTKRLPDARAAAKYVARERERLERETSAYHTAFFDSTLPDAILDAVSANLVTLRSTTVMRTADGRMNAFEGCSDSSGCCPMNCTHVWNYAQSMAFLFPSLERTTRDTDFGHNTLSAGRMAFRTLLPLVNEHWAFRPAADGQMGSVLRLYREWRHSGDTGWLKTLWPHARAALEFAWSPGNKDGWDRNADGVMEGIQHNTYDIEFVGPNMMCGSWYLAALEAGARMAEAMGETENAARYRELARRGAEGHEALWNGEYYEQHVRFDAEGRESELSPVGGQLPVDDGFPRYQYTSGCLSDQIVGLWFARCLGLNEILPADRVRKTLSSIHKYNFRSDLSSHEACQRVYALNDEAGLLLCSWPHGGRPQYPFPYADEVWTGIEYHVASHLIYEGLPDEGLEIVKATRARHDGARRNPWDEFECGHHYARPLSSWALLLAWSGYLWDGVDHSITFTPVVEGPFRCFFSTATAWGVYERRGDRQRIRVLYGTLSLNAWKNARGQVDSDSGSVSCTEMDGGLVFQKALHLTAGQTVTASV